MGTEMLRGVYPERSEGLSMTTPVLVVKVHYRAAGLGARPIRVWPHRSTPGAINRAATTACPPLCLQLFIHPAFLEQEHCVSETIKSIPFAHRLLIHPFDQRFACKGAHQQQ